MQNDPGFTVTNQIDTISLSIPAGLCNYEQSILKTAAVHFSHILPKDVSHSGIEFADVIAEHYDPNNPQTNEMIRILRGIQ